MKFINKVKGSSAFGAGIGTGDLRGNAWQGKEVGANTTHYRLRDRNTS
jgi:hypothetical protein